MGKTTTTTKKIKFGGKYGWNGKSLGMSNVMMYLDTCISTFMRKLSRFALLEVV